MTADVRYSSAQHFEIYSLPEFRHQFQVINLK